VERFHETDHMRGPVHKIRLGHSGAPPLGGEPGIHSRRPVGMDSGLAASRRPGMTPHMIRTSETLY
jgi:hypothetical protein